MVDAAQQLPDLNNVGMGPTSWCVARIFASCLVRFAMCTGGRCSDIVYTRASMFEHLGIVSADMLAESSTPMPIFCSGRNEGALTNKPTLNWMCNVACYLVTCPLPTHPHTHTPTTGKTNKDGVLGACTLVPSKDAHLCAVVSR